MPSRSARIAYLKRMLRRLEGEDMRIEALVSSGQLSPEGGKLGIEQLKKTREQLLSELRTLEGEGLT